MTPQQDRALAALQTLGDRLAPRARSSFLGALAGLASGADIDAAVRALAEGDVEAAAKALLPRASTLAFERALRVAVADVIVEVGPMEAREIASILGVRFQFIPGSPAAAAALQNLDEGVVLPVTEDATKAVRSLLASGAFDGIAPRVTAVQFRQFVGLTETDAGFVASFVEALRTDPMSALRFELRDARYDGTLVQSATLSEEQIAAMTSRYVDRLKNWRAETWARTMTNQALRESQRAAWSQAVDNLGIDRTRVSRKWVTAHDDRVRPEHVVMDGDTTTIDKPYSNGDMTVGESSPWNCRCVEVVRLLPRAA